MPTRAKLIEKPRNKMPSNLRCSICDVQIDVMIAAILLIGHTVKIDVVHLSKDYHEVNIYKEN